MKAVEFQTRLNPDSTLNVPPELVALFKEATYIRAILLIPENDEDWARLTAEQFAKGYSEADSAYDHL
ncbi:MAG: hypothetical protein ACUVV0_12830 [Anaerolineae bacterium]